MSRLLPRLLRPAAVALVAASAVACGPGQPGDAATDREAGTLALAIAYPRQVDAEGFARAALDTRLGRSGRLAILEASDLDARSDADPSARLVIRIHVPAHHSTSFGGGASTAAFDACYRMEYTLPSSALVGDPERIGCPHDAVPITPAPPPAPPHLPANTSAVLVRVLRRLPPDPTRAGTVAALRSALLSDVEVDVLVESERIAVAAGVGSAGQLECRVAVRAGDRVRAVAPRAESLLPGEIGCRAEVAFLR